MERSLELIVGLLGILKAGGAYVPLDPAYPKSGSRSCWRTRGRGAARRRSDCSTKLPARAADAMCAWIGTGQDSRALTVDQSKQQSTADNLAYVIYTSGSTGLPKGVEVRHRGHCASFVWGRLRGSLGGTQTLLHLAPISFSTQRLLKYGAHYYTAARCVLFPEKCRMPQSSEHGAIKKYRVSTLLVNGGAV